VILLDGITPPLVLAPQGKEPRLEGSWMAI
jgi:hypothetical protein